MLEVKVRVEVIDYRLQQEGSQAEHAMVAYRAGYEPESISNWYRPAINVFKQ